VTATVSLAAPTEIQMLVASPAFTVLSNSEVRCSASGA
jgi:hypothetical protein